MSKQTSQTSQKALVDVSLKLAKSTPGTHVLRDAESGFAVYVPRSYFAAAGLKPDSGAFRLSIVPE